MGKRLSPAAVAFSQFLLDEGAVLLGHGGDKAEKAPRQKADGKRAPGIAARSGKSGAARGKACA